jgi:hypothetical protein
MKSCGLSQRLALTELDIMSIIVAGGCHDFEHPGFNNIYLVEN